ncbi:MAG TPA: hypothetical protein VJU86_09020 [Pyrinomonadaceae bacterium]|nr:hypothetical protein [Pyrinomonadaceae bacterium]
MSILFGINTYPASGDAERRQLNGLNSLFALKKVSLMHLYLEGDPQLGRRPVPSHQLKLDSEMVSGRQGKRKPLVSEIFHELAVEATTRGLRYFAFANSDILVSQRAVDYALASHRQAYIFSRVDFEKDTQREQGIMPWGTDLFIVDGDWWLENEWRFRAYILGEPIWDNVYTALLLCHADGILLNRDTYITHEIHPPQWHSSPFAQYLRLLAALDAPYFSLWVKYSERLSEMRERGSSWSEELALQEEIFVSDFSKRDKAEQALRSVKAHMRFAILNRWDSRTARQQS